MDWSDIAVVLIVWMAAEEEEVLTFLRSHFLGCEVFVLPLFRKVFLWGPLRACFGFATPKATLAHVKNFIDKNQL